MASPRASSTTDSTNDLERYSSQWLLANESDINAALAKNMNPLKYAKLKPMFDLLNQYEEAMAQTNTANEQRYQQGLNLLGSLNQMYSSYTPKAQTVDTHTYGEAARKTIETAKRENIASATQNMVSSGLLSSSMMPAINSRYQADATQQHLELDDSLARYRQEQLDKVYNQQQEIAQQRLSNLADVQMQKLQWIYNKEDAAPDANLLANQLQLMAKKPGWFQGLSQSQKDWWTQQVAKAKTTTT